MNNTWDKLIKTYFYVTDKYHAEMQWHCQRMSNNANPVLNDCELITICLFCIHCYGIERMKSMHRFAKDHLMDRFPSLGIYQSPNNRIDRLLATFTA